MVKLSALLSVSILTLTACGGAGGNGSSFGPPQTPSGLHPAAITNLAGQYEGEMNDAGLGAGEASVNLSQRKLAVGGSVDVVFGSNSVTEVMAATLNPTNNAISGTLIGTVGSAVCTFRMIGTYSRRAVLAGSYRAIHGCAGDTGSYRFNEECSYVNHGFVNRAIIRPDAHGVQPC